MSGGVVDIGDDTNLAGTSNEIVLTGDTLSIHTDIARDSELNTAVTETGDALILSGQEESIMVDVSAVMISHNTLYGLDSGDAVYLTYDSGKDYYFAVKYFTGESSSSASTQFTGSGASTFTGPGTTTISE